MRGRPKNKYQIVLLRLTQVDCTRAIARCTVITDKGLETNWCVVNMKISDIPLAQVNNLNLLMSKINWLRRAKY